MRSRPPAQRCSPSPAPWPATCSTTGWTPRVFPSCAAFASMFTFAIYMAGSERAGQRHEAVTTLLWAFGFATLFWALITPWCLSWRS